MKPTNTALPAAPSPDNGARSQWTNIPQELRNLPNWILYKLEERDGRMTKVPYAVKGHKASTTDSSTWATFDRASQVFNDDPFEYAGLGCVITSPYIGIDIDHCRNTETGELDQRGKDAITMLGTFGEISQSGTGVHLWVKGKMPAGGNRRDGVEIYGHGRYFTMTGLLVAGAQATISDNQAGLDAFHRKYIVTHNGTPTTTSTAKDDSQSGQDMQLACAIVRRLGVNASKDELVAEFRARGTPRDKWQRDDYIPRTITAAIEFVRNSNADSPAAVDDGAIQKTFSTVRADQVQPQPTYWLWPDRIVLGGLTLIVGNPDTAKSLVGSDGVATVTTGRKWPDGPNTMPPCEVVMLVGEDDIQRTTVPRLQVAGADLTKVHFIQMTKISRNDKTFEREVHLDTDLGMLEQFVAQNPAVKLVVVDPISNYLGAKNMNAEQDVRSVLIPLKDIAERHNIAIVSIMHLNKKVDLSAIHRIGGAMAFTGVARATWMFDYDKDAKNYRMLRVKNNLAANNGGLTYSIEVENVTLGGVEQTVPYIKWLGTTDKTADDVLSPGKGEAHRPVRERLTAEKWLLDYLADGPKSLNDIIADAKADANISRATLYRAKESLGIRAYEQDGCRYWELDRVKGGQWLTDDPEVL